MKSGDAVGEIVAALVEIGLTAHNDRRSGTIVVSRIPDARRPVVPWVIHVDQTSALVALETRLDLAPKSGGPRRRRSAITDIASVIGDDLRVYEPDEGPFALDAAGQLIPVHGEHGTV